jgi:hypothetical protein
MKLAVAIPNMGTIKAQTVFCLIRALKDFPHDYDVLFKEGSILHANREELVKTAIKLKCTHLLFLDSDMYFEKDAILRLIRRKKDIIGANAHRRKLPIEATVLNPKKSKGLTKCEAVGAGFMLINLKVFRDMEEPWFFWKFDGTITTGEDHWFCERAREVGYEIWCDLDIPIGHIGDYKY